MVNGTISEQVEDLENKMAAYARVMKVVKDELVERGFDAFNEEIFFKKIVYFQTLHINKVLGYCPFPKSCRYYKCCSEKNCNADVCDNGYPYKGY